MKAPKGVYLRKPGIGNQEKDFPNFWFLKHGYIDATLDKKGGLGIDAARTKKQHQ